MSIINISVDKLYPHPDNPRKDLGDLAELTESIKAKGILQNLTVVPADEGYTVIIGHRRLAAAKAAGLEEVPCAVAEMTPEDQIKTMMVENMQRSDLTIYEQAQGFQLMLDMGCTVESVARDTGFSEATVRRRVKLTELDQEKLREVSTRQVSLSDLDELAKVEDIKTRNRCLATIGTENFDFILKQSLRKQAIKKKLPEAKKLLQKSGLTQVEKSKTYGGKYERLWGYDANIANWDGKADFIPKKAVCYYIDAEDGMVRFFEKRKKKEAVKRPPEEIERKQKIESAHTALAEKAAVAYGLRADFVKGLTYGAKNETAILRGALIAGVLNAIDFMSYDRDAVGKALGLDMSKYDPERGVKAVDALGTVDKKAIPGMIYALFSDKAKHAPVGYNKLDYPKYERNAELDGLYAWLTSLGYVMSDEEKALMDGTHELFHLTDGEGAGGQ